MVTKHILPPPEEFFADDFPEEMSRDEMIKMLKDLETNPPEKVAVMNNNVDLHLDAAEVKPFGQRSWIDQYGPKPPGLFVRSLDVIIALLALYVVWLIIRVWFWIFVN
jgi:hypothetical protein